MAWSSGLYAVAAGVSRLAPDPCVHPTVLWFVARTAALSALSPRQGQHPLTPRLKQPPSILLISKAVGDMGADGSTSEKMVSAWKAQAAVKIVLRAAG